jgi:ribosomal protein L11 methyltransferase
MYLWQRLAAPRWCDANEIRVRNETGTDLATIERPGHKQLVLEVSCKSQRRAKQLQQHFGGRVIKLRRDWLKQCVRAGKTEPLRIGNRLVVTNTETTPSGHRNSDQLVIPAGAAFGTGQHPTTAMSLRMVEELTRHWGPGWVMADLGTGSGIFALAAKRFGARAVIGIDTDPIAISTAKSNARLNRINGIKFVVADVLKWRPRGGIKLVTANLFSELLIAVLPKLRRIPWLILSGVVRDQERNIVRALKQNRFAIVRIRRRGKWIAMLVSKVDRQLRGPMLT